MNSIEKLIAQHCPDGVEYFPLCDIFDIKNGYTPSKANNSYWDSGTIPWFRMEDIRLNGRILSDSIQHVTPSAIKGKLFPANSIIIATTATIGEHALITVESIANQQFTYLVKKQSKLNICLDIKFFYYYCFILSEWCKENINISGFASVDMGKFKKYPIPIPPMPVQEEIVRILDKFTALEAELEAELEARRKQYEYYRNMFLNFGDEYGFVTLDKMTKNLDSKRKPVTKAARTAGNIPYYGASGIVDYVSEHIFDGDYLLISEDGANLLARSTPIAFSISGKSWVNNHAHVLEFKTYEERRFVEIYLNSIDLNSFISGGAQPKLNQTNLNKIPIPNPPIEKQKKIVDILDKFSTYIDGMNEGLPAEIRARRSQYEFYRNKLLAFN